MNCFEWQNHSSDFIDGSLQEPHSSEATQHLEDCPECKSHYKHYNLIIAALADQPRAQLPSHIRKAPLAAVLSHLESAKMSLSQWARIPWYIRVTGEAVGIVAVVLIFISSGPKIRAIYQKNIESNVNHLKERLSLTENPGEGYDPNLISAGDKASAPNNAPGSSQETGSQETGSKEVGSKETGLKESGEDELSGEDEETPIQSVRAGDSQLWRFTLKTVSPDELRPLVIQALHELGIPATTPGLGGTQVPGGIEFDLILPQTMVPNVKTALEKLIPGAAGKKDSPVGSEIFSWYKVKSRKKLEKGTSKVVIWLSQPTN